MKKTNVLLLLCILAFTALDSAEAGSKKNPAEKKAKILVMFRSSGPAREASGLKMNLCAREFEEQVVSNEEIMDELKKRCKGVEFVGSTTPLGRDETMKKVDDLSGDVDGMVIFGPMSFGHAFGGPLAEKLIETNLPKIVVFPLWGMWQESFSYQGYKEKEMKLLTAHISIVRDKCPSVFAARFDDLANKINLIGAISELKGLKILSITDRPPLGAYTPRYGDTDKYEKRCVDNLKALGVELKTIPQEELYDKFQEILKDKKGREKAEQIAEMWIGQAKEVNWNELTREDIIKSASVYLAMKELRDQYECSTVTSEGYGVFAGYKKGPIPSQGLASTQLSTESTIAAPSETLLYSLIAQQLGYNATGRKGFNGDYVIDHFNQIAYIMHCEGPLNIYGGDERCSFDIRELPQHYDNQCGGIVLIRYPRNKTVTVVGMSIHDKKIGVFTGESVPPENYFDNLEYNWCRSKIFVKTDTEALLDNVNWEVFNQHRVVFYGDYREEFKNMAMLMGYDFVEVDK